MFNGISLMLICRVFNFLMHKTHLLDQFQNKSIDDMFDEKKHRFFEDGDDENFFAIRGQYYKQAAMLNKA